jgi:uncharacterized protein YegP (UPF0339 family)
VASETTIYFEIASAVGGCVWRIKTYGNHEILCSSEILKDVPTCVYAMTLVRDQASGETAYWARTNKEWVAF